MVDLGKNSADEKRLSHGAPVATTVEVRRVDPAVDDLSGFAALVATVFQDDQEPDADRVDFMREGWSSTRVLGAFDGPEVVGSYRSWDWALSLPGGTQATVDAISAVTVAPTHRRRGLLRSMITADLDDAVARGVCAAVLLAARATIYPRFGFGPATRAMNWTLDTNAAQLRSSAQGAGSVRFIEAQELFAVAPELYNRSRRPGNTDRRDRSWRIRLGLLAQPQVPNRYQRHLVHRDVDGQIQGFATFTWKEKWDGWQPLSTAQLEDLQAATGEAYLELMRVLINLDNVTTLVANHRPLGEPLAWLLTDHRALRVTAVDDFLWARILDVSAALSARGYESPGLVDFVVHDPMGYADGRYRLEVSATGQGDCRRMDSTTKPDLEIDLDVLSALWLGDGDIEAAALAGRVLGHRPGAIAELGRMLRTRQLPWTPDGF